MSSCLEDWPELVVGGYELMLPAGQRRTLSSAAASRRASRISPRTSSRSSVFSISPILRTSLRRILSLSTESRWGSRSGSWRGREWESRRVSRSGSWRVREREPRRALKCGWPKVEGSCRLASFIGSACGTPANGWKGCWWECCGAIGASGGNSRAGIGILPSSFGRAPLISCML